MPPLNLSSLHSGGLITNYYCSSRCRHCLYRSSPHWPKAYMSRETARLNFAKVAALGCRSLHIGGGEPLLQADDLAVVFDVAREVGIAIEYVETNSSWFRDQEEACGILSRLKARGLTTLLISISPFHNEFVPFAKTQGVMDACQKVGISIFPWVSEFINDLNAFDSQKPHSLDEFQKRFGRDYVAKLPQRYWISNGGRALETFGAYSPQKTAERLISENAGGCRELANTSHFHIDLDGNYIPGLCAGLAIQRDDLGSPLDVDKYPLLSRLYSGGIGALFRYATEEFGFVPAEGYALKCHLCYDIRHFLALGEDRRFEELQPEGHYLYG